MGTGTREQVAELLPGIDVELLGALVDEGMPYQRVRMVLARDTRTDVVTMVLSPGGPIKLHVTSTGDLTVRARVRTMHGITVGAPYAAVAALDGYAIAIEKHAAVDEILLAKPRGGVRYKLGAPGLALPENLWSETAEEWVATHRASLLVTEIVWGNPLGKNPFVHGATP
ncbi:MAG: hypothetical protein SFX73_32365 [Kofleriaceae bacterium]|nr:hypothetical protein [Kofleriaceae bacterium]